MNLISPTPSSPPSRVVVTGVGVVSPLGRGIADTRSGLFETPRYHGREVTRFSVADTRCKSAAMVEKESLQDLCPHPRRAAATHLSSLMMMAATHEAMECAGKVRPEFAVIGTTSGGMSHGEAYFRSLQNGTNRRHRPAALANYMPQKPVLDAMEFCGLRLPVQLVANACASGSNAIGMGWQSIRSGSAQCVMVGGYDALSELVFVGFDSLQAATPEICRPFDQNRTGLILGEAAAVLVLENLDHARARGAKILAELAGYGISTDNHHLTQPHPSGNAVKAAMEQALRSAGDSADAVDYINAHGTATVFNDATEGAAISAVCRPGVAVSSTKSMIGHTLGAAGAIEAVVSILALETQRIPPSLNFRSGDPSWKFEIVCESPPHTPIRGVLSNSLGFGGTNASLYLKAAAAA